MDADSWCRHVVVVTGTIGSGKSTCVGILEEQGALAVSADKVAREVVAPGTEGLRAVEKRFGKPILLKDGSLDREQLGQIIFSDSTARRDLESIVHPLIQERVGRIFSAVLSKGYPLLVYDCPLFFEAGLYKKQFRGVVLVSAPPEICAERLAKRSNLSLTEAKKRLSSQWPIEQKIAKSDVVIDNSGSIEELRVRTRAAFELLAQEAGKNE